MCLCLPIILIYCYKNLSFYKKVLRDLRSVHTFWKLVKESKRIKRSYLKTMCE